MLELKVLLIKIATIWPVEVHGLIAAWITVEKVCGGWKSHQIGDLLI